MIKTFFKYAKQRWWTVLIDIPTCYLSWFLAIITMMWFGLLFEENGPLISSDMLSAILLFLIGFIVLILNTSIPWLIITIPASREIGRERQKPSFKYFLIYHAIVCVALILVLIFPFGYYYFFY
jgi:small-conductance mechanosensitive channel